LWGVTHRKCGDASALAHERYTTGPWRDPPYSPRVLAALMAEEFARIGRRKPIEEAAHRTYAVLHA
jgi:hypothetical protein